MGIAGKPSSLVVLLLLVACGGGGGGGGGDGTSPVVYAGNTNPAVVTAANASKLAAGVVGSDETASTILGISVESSDATKNRGSGVMDLALRLNRGFRGTVLRMSDAQRVAPAAQIEHTEPCDNGMGSTRTSGTLSDVNFTGTLTITFSNCLVDGVTLNGQATMRVDAFSFALPQGIPEDSTLSFARLTIRGPGVNVDAGGSLRLQLNFGTNTETVTGNFVSQNNSTAGMSKTENLVVVNVYDNMFSPTSFTATMSGRVFDQVHGYVDVTTLAPVRFGTLTQAFPGSGQILLTGSSNRSIRVTALSPVLARLELDIDSIGGFEHTATLKWTDLAGPIGADLRDSDGDGMHNSWETAVGLNPNLADALNDDDGDGFNNLAEYQGGGDPKSATSIPTMLVGPVTQVAGAVAVPNSDTTRPGKSGIASDGTNFLLVSCRDLGPTVGLFGVALSGSGQVLNTFPISNESCPVGPAVAFDGINYLVVLWRNGQIYGIRVTPGGVVLDAAGGFPISTAGSNFHPAVAFDGTSYLVVWNKFANGTQYEIYGARVTPTGGALGEFPIFTAPGEQVFPALAFDGTNYLVIWRDTRSGSGPSIDTDLFGTRVTSAGNILDPLGIAIATAPGIQEPGGIAFDGTNYLVVWNHMPMTNMSPPPDGKIFGRRITPAGDLLDGTASSDGIAISTGTFSNHSSSVAFAGSNYIVAWAVGSFPNFPPAGIFAARVSRNGTRIDGLPVELGVPLSGNPATSSQLVYPVAASLGQSALISWVDNSENSSAQKDILGVSISGF